MPGPPPARCRPYAIPPNNPVKFCRPHPLTQPFYTCRIKLSSTTVEQRRSTPCSPHFCFAVRAGHSAGPGRAGIAGRGAPAAKTLRPAVALPPVGHAGGAASGAAARACAPGPGGGVCGYHTAVQPDRSFAGSHRAPRRRCALHGRHGGRRAHGLHRAPRRAADGTPHGAGTPRCRRNAAEPAGPCVEPWRAGCCALSIWRLCRLAHPRPPHRAAG